MPEAAKSNSESLKKLYHDMLLIRRFEERAGQLYGMGLKIGRASCRERV